MMAKVDRRIVVGLPIVVAAGIAAWLLIPTFAQTRPDLTLNLASVSQPDDVTAPSPTPAKLVSVPDAADLDRISLSRQAFRRGGMGSRALMTFTVRNANDYDVKDLELLCAFRSRDGRYVTERRKLLAETVSMKSRKAFPMTHIGYVNVRASQAKCALVTASRV